MLWNGHRMSYSYPVMGALYAELLVRRVPNHDDEQIGKIWFVKQQQAHIMPSISQ
jgi:hypothetical protein